jgi:hypothetical protein
MTYYANLALSKQLIFFAIARKHHFLLPALRSPCRAHQFALGGASSLLLSMMELDVAMQPSSKRGRFTPVGLSIALNYFSSMAPYAAPVHVESPFSPIAPGIYPSYTRAGARAEISQLFEPRWILLLI